jgi:hypothetical protein
MSRPLGRTNLKALFLPPRRHQIRGLGLSSACDERRGDNIPLELVGIAVGTPTLLSTNVLNSFTYSIPAGPAGPTRLYWMSGGGRPGWQIWRPDHQEPDAARRAALEDLRRAIGRASINWRVYQHGQGSLELPRGIKRKARSRSWWTSMSELPFVTSASAVEYSRHFKELPGSTLQTKWKVYSLNFCFGG